MTSDYEQFLTAARAEWDARTAGMTLEERRAEFARELAEIVSEEVTS